MGNIFRKNKIKFDDSLTESLTGNEYIELNARINDIDYKLSILNKKIDLLEKNTQENIRLLSCDIHHLNKLTVDDL